MALFTAFLALSVFEMVLFSWVTLIIGANLFWFIGSVVSVAPYALANRDQAWTILRQALSQTELFKIMLYEVFGVNKVHYYLNTGALRTLFILCQAIAWVGMLLTLD